MTWLRLDDQFQHHDKVAPLSDRAWRLHVTAMLECSRLLTDGKIRRKVVSTWPGSPRGASLRVAIDELLESGLWEPTDEGWEVHDFLDWNPTSEQAKTRRAVRSEAGKQGGKRSAEGRAKGKQPPKQVLDPVVEQPLDGGASKPEAKLNPVPVPVPVPAEQQQQAEPIRCPVPLPVDDSELAKLELAIGIPKAIAKASLLAWAGRQSDPGDLRFLGAWLKSAFAAVTGDWNRGGDTRARMRTAAMPPPENERRDATGYEALP